MLPTLHSVVIDPSSTHYLQNKLFDLSDSTLNRDDSLLPLHRLSVQLHAEGIAVNTVDLLLDNRITTKTHQYFSLGMLSNIPALSARQDIELKAFLIMEPPIVAPELYAALPALTARFEKVYVHNTQGDGYSLAGVDLSKLQKLYWPQPYIGVIERYWHQQNRLKRIVVINGNHKPRMRLNELYSKRIQAMGVLSKLKVVDLYGRGWQRWWSRTSFWLPYWLNRSRLMSIYRGECASKYEVLSRYQFCLCFENMAMMGYVTEKLFDCLYAGTIPIYWGAPDIAELIPSNAYIDARQFSSWSALWLALMQLSEDEIQSLREAGRGFLSSPAFLTYYHALPNIMATANKVDEYVA